jgi:hypothetical protein
MGDEDTEVTAALHTLDILRFSDGCTYPNSIPTPSSVQYSTICTQLSRPCRLQLFKADRPLTEAFLVGISTYKKPRSSSHSQQGIHDSFARYSPQHEIELPLLPSCSVPGGRRSVGRDKAQCGRPFSI